MTKSTTSIGARGRNASCRNASQRQLASTSALSILWLVVVLIVTFVPVLFPKDAEAQNVDPLSYTRTIPGYDAAKSQGVMAEHFTGAWRVTITDSGEPLSGIATVAEDGSTALVLNTPDGEEHYVSTETDAYVYLPGTGPITASLGVRFEKDKVAEPVYPEAGLTPAMPLALKRDQQILSLSLEDQKLDLDLTWHETKRDRIRMQLAARADKDTLTGRWSEEIDGSLKGGGDASWLQGDPDVAGVLVVDNQLDASAGYNYPWRPDGESIEHLQTTRTLVIYGSHLAEFADGMDIQSLSDAISYTTDPRAGSVREKIFEEAFEKAKVENPEQYDALLVTASLSQGIKPGSKTMTVNGEKGAWPLLFANQMAIMRFVRTGDLATKVFYPGDIGYVRLSFEADIPFDSIGVVVSRGRGEGVEDGVLLARRLDDDDPIFKNYVTEPIHFYHRSNEALAPPADPNALRVPVLEGAVVNARLVDPAEALTLPPVASATIFATPDQLGSLWKESLDRVAVCYSEPIEDYDEFQMQWATAVSRVILTKIREFALIDLVDAESPVEEITLRKGDHAAALLIRDEFVKQTMAVIPEFSQRAKDIEYARAYRARAKASSKVAAEPFWRTLNATWIGPARAKATDRVTAESLWRSLKAVWSDEGNLLDSVITIPLAETLDEAAIAKKLGIKQDVARRWAEEQTMAASLKQTELMQMAISRAQNAGDCKVEEMLLIAGHRSPAIVGQILPRLVKLETESGPPKRQYWVADQPAIVFVNDLHSIGKAVRSLDAYSEADTNVTLAVAALVTIGATAVLEGFGYAGAALWTSLTADAVEMTYGLLGVDKYFEGESYYEFAQGAAATLGGGVLDDAEAHRQSAIMTAVGVLLPSAGTAVNVSRLRHFKNVQNGRALLKSKPGALDDLTALTDVERTSLAGYYTDLAARVNKSGIDKLSEADRAAYKTFADYFEPIPASGASPSASSPNPLVKIDPDATLPPSAFDPEATTSLPPSNLDETLPTPANDPNFSGTFEEPGVVKGSDLPDTIRDPAPDPLVKIDPDATLPPSAFDPEATTTLPPPNLDETLPPSAFDPEATTTLPPPNLDETLPPSAFGPEATTTLPPPNLDETLPPGAFDPEATTALPPGSNPNLDETFFELPPAGDPRLDPAGRDLFDVIKNAPDDDSLPLPAPSRPVPNYVDTPPGSLSNHLTSAEVEDLFRPGRNLTPDELVQKADLIRSGRVPPEVAQGDPRLLKALDDAFGIKVKRPEVTDGGTIIEPGPGSGSTLDDTMDFPPPGADPLTPKTDPNFSGTFEEPGVVKGSDLPDTIRDPSPGSLVKIDPDATLPPSAFDPEATTAIGPGPDATVAPPGKGASNTTPEFGLYPGGKNPDGEIIFPDSAPPPIVPKKPTVVPNDALETQLSKLEEAVESASPDVGLGNNPRLERLERLEDARVMLSHGTAEELKVADQLDRNMRSLGVPEYDSMAHSSLFYPHGKDYISGFGPRMREAQIVAEGILEYGQRPISLAEFARTTGVSPSAARAAVEAAAMRRQIPYGGGDIIPVKLIR